MREAGSGNIGSIITMLIADQVRKVVSIPLLLVSNLLLLVCYKRESDELQCFPKMRKN